MGGGSLVATGVDGLAEWLGRRVIATAPPMKSAFETLLSTFDEAFAEFNRSRAMRFLQSADFRPSHYASALREMYFYTRDNPQLQVSLALAFRGEQRKAVRRIVGHALDEVGHDLMALDDLKALGGDVDGIPEERPLPSTLPLVAYPIYLMSQGNPIGYLGQIFFLEFMPTRSGSTYIETLQQAGIPQSAMSFLAEHATVDEHHNRLMQHHVRDLIRTPEQLEAACEAIRVAAYNYAQMLAGAFDAAERYAHLDAAIAEARALSHA